MSLYNSVLAALEAVISGGRLKVTSEGEAGSALLGSTMDGGASWSETHTITNSADMTGAADVSAAPSSGQKIVITDVIISVGTAMSVTLLEETSGTVLGGPYYLPANGSVQITPRSKWKLPVADKKVRADASAAGNITVETWTYSEA